MWHAVRRSLLYFAARCVPLDVLGCWLALPASAFAPRAGAFGRSCVAGMARPTPRLAHAAQAKSRTPGRVRGDGDAFVPLTDDEKGELVSQALEALEAEGGAVRTGLLCGVHAS